MATKGRPVRVVVAGQLPPPVGGQNLNVQRFLALLGGIEGIRAEHWKFEFTRAWSDARRGRGHKVLELVRVLWRLAGLRMRGRIDYVLFSSGGPHLVPIVRDIVLLPAACLMARRVCVHFQAAGIAARLPELPAGLRWLLRTVHRPCHGAIVLTEFGRRDAEALGMTKIAVIPNAVEDRRTELASGGGDRDEAPVFLHVGHLCADKGTPQLLRAAARLRREGAVFRLRLVGECLPPYSAEQLARELRELDLVDVVDVEGLKTGEELDAAYAGGDLFVFSSVAPYESFGLVLIEAMMWALPAVVTDWRANAEVFGAAPGGICFTTGGNLEASLAAALSEALARREEWGAWGARNRKRYEESFGIEVLRENLQEYFSAEAPRGMAKEIAAK